MPKNYDPNLFRELDYYDMRSIGQMWGQEYLVIKSIKMFRGVPPLYRYVVVAKPSDADELQSLSELYDGEDFKRFCNGARGAQFLIWWGHQTRKEHDIFDDDGKPKLIEHPPGWLPGSRLSALEHLKNAMVADWSIKKNQTLFDDVSKSLKEVVADRMDWAFFVGTDNTSDIQDKIVPGASWLLYERNVSTSDNSDDTMEPIYQANSGDDSEWAFIKKGNSWDIFFRGEQSRYSDLKGVQYIAALLQSPGVEFYPLELKQAVDGESSSASDLYDAVPSDTEQYLGSMTNEQLEEDSLSSINSPIQRPTVKDIKTITNTAFQLWEGDGFKEDGREWRQFQRYAFNAYGIRARIGKDGPVLSRPLARLRPDQDKARKSIAGCINRFYSKIKSDMPKLEAHLRQHLKPSAIKLVYSHDPDSPIRWLIKT